MHDDVSPKDAIQLVRQKRPGSIETQHQEQLIYESENWKTNK